MPGGSEDDLLIGIGRVGHQVVVGPDQSIDIDQILWSGKESGAAVNHEPILPSRGPDGHVTGPDEQGFATTGTMPR